jgi:serine/threonine protein kinase
LNSPECRDLHETALRLSQDELPAGWSLVGSSKTAKVAYNEQRNLYYKEFLPRSPFESLKAMIRGSRATRARKNDALLHNAGFDVPVNLAWGSLPRRREYLISRGVDGKGITHWLRETLADRTGDALAVRRQLVRELGVFIGRLHATGFIHGDLRTSNVLASLHDGGFAFALIDNERTVLMSPPAGKLLLKNLMQLNMLLPSDLTHTDRWRFFLSWRRQMRDLSNFEANILAKESYQWAFRRLHKKGLV